MSSYSYQQIINKLKYLNISELFIVINYILSEIENKKSDIKNVDNNYIISNIEQMDKINSNTITKDSIDIFHITSQKKDNDAHNKMREDIICSVINNTIPSDWFENSKWAEFKKNINEFINNICSYENKDILTIKATQAGGRRYNYDIILSVTFTDNTTKNIKVEFKYNSEKITEYPEFLSVAASYFITPDSPDYASFFYDNYLHDIIELYNNELDINIVDIPDKTTYLKYVYNTVYSKHSLFQVMYDNESVNDTIKKNKKIIVDKSIDDYLMSYIILDITSLNTKLKESQSDKVFMLYKNGKFYSDKILEDELVVTDDITIMGKSNKNTVVCNTKNGTTTINMLLRWKNHAGILFPAWQIKLVR